MELNSSPSVSPLQERVVQTKCQGLSMGRLTAPSLVCGSFRRTLGILQKSCPLGSLLPPQVDCTDPLSESTQGWPGVGSAAPPRAGPALLSHVLSAPVQREGGSHSEQTRSITYIDPNFTPIVRPALSVSNIRLSSGYSLHARDGIPVLQIRQQDATKNESVGAALPPAPQKYAWKSYPQDPRMQLY